MKYLAVIVLQALLGLVALAISLTSCVIFNLSVHPFSLTVTIMFALMMIVYVGTDAGKLLEEK
ncbi:hypothetical protein [Macrococcus armenti]|uniref:hypothetical protein n=1 Tax=Macrococcus armenti TaxID=2875764 RepID=UPI001CD3C0BF|nr:hypothetical protein [Macrococcus armenti]UBH10634.1 hypothetical protein LAU38_10405 [Macrococcus armenti]